MKKFILLLIVSLVAIIAGCDLDDSGTPPNPGFIVVTTEYNENDVVPHDEGVSGINTEGTLKWANDDASGYITHFYEPSGQAGKIRVENGRAPGTWLLEEFNGPCFRALPFYYQMRRADFNYLRCTIGRGLSFNFNPLPLNADAPPATFDILVNTQVTSTYGMPTVQFRNYLGTLVAKVRATRIYQGRVIGSTTALRSLPSGSYSAQVWNVTANGSTKLAGTAPMRVYRPQPPPNPCDVQYVQTEDGQQIALAPPTCQ
jgi:hypothetical protein